MNESDRRELSELMQRQQLLEKQLTTLAADIRKLEARAGQAEAAAASSPSPVAAAPVSTKSEPSVQPAPIAVPPPLPLHARVPVAKPIEPSAAAATAPAPTVSEFVPEFVKPQSNKATEESKSAISASSAIVSSPAVEAPEASFEMRLGTYWLVRIGAVMILTGLVFFGNLAYQKMGAAGKVSLLYLASGLLLGAGAWWQRRSVKESLKNYAQVLFAGGLAAVYFTTYAAHHLPTLRVIQSALLDGALLLGWAGLVVWIADRRKSEVLALFAIALAYYTSIITPVSGFTLYSNLVLALAAMFFLVRNRWAGLSWASLLATYAGYAWWRFHQGVEGLVPPWEGLWLGASFLSCYWVIFTLAAFLSKHPAIVGNARASFVTCNNGAFFTLFLLTMLQVKEGEFWKFSLGYGAGLLVLAELARRFLAAEPITKNTYLTQGLVLVTVGLVAKFTGHQLALVLAAESVILFILGVLRRNIFLQTGAYISGAMAVAWGIDVLERDDRQALWLGVALGALMALNAFWSHWKMLWADKRELRPVTAYFTALALVMWVATTWFNTTTANFPLALVIEAVLLAASIYVVRVREFALLGQGLLIMGLVAWLGRFAFATTPPPWWNPLAIIGLTLALSHWWQKQKAVSVQSNASVFLQTAYALAIVVVALVWAEPHCSPGSWLMLTSVLALGATAYGVITRAWPLAACAQIFLAVSCGAFALRLITGRVEWFYALAPMAALGFLSLATWQWFKRKPESYEQTRTVLLNLGLAYRWVALAMSLCWVNEYIPQPERVWVFALIGLSVFFFAGWRRSREAMLASAAYTMTGLVTLWLLLPHWDWVYFPNFLAVLALLGQQQLARRLADRYPVPDGVHHAVIVVGGLTLWKWLTQWVLLGSGGFYLTASWSGLAFVLFGAGVVLREKLYRWVGLGILAVAIGRVFLYDVWQLERIYRVLSFMALGIVLVVLGFIYSKYQDKLRQWL